MGSILPLVAVVLGLSTATAGGEDLSKEAARQMKLSFDMEEVEGMLARPAPAPSNQPTRAALPLEPNSDAVSVTVFQDRALVTRVLTARLKEGSTSVVFEGLPLGLSPDSLHAFVKGSRVGDREGRIIGVELLSGQAKVEETDRIQAIRKELEVHAAELGEIRDRIEALLAQRAYLRTTLLSQPENGRPQPGMDQVKGTLTYVGDAERDIAARLRKEQKRAEELDEKMAPLLVKLKNPVATGNRVRVDLESQGGELEIGLRYQVSGARWWPAYNARLDPGSSKVTIEYYGIVSQETGEAWDGVELALSTANASVSGSLPELTPWYLGRDSYASTYGVVDNLMEGRGYYQDPTEAPMQQAASLPEPAVETVMTASVQGAGAVVFGIPGQRTVAGDGSQQRLPVGSQTFTARMELATAPKVVPEVFRQARLRYEGNMPLLPGSVATFVGGDYVGSGALKTVVPGEEMLLSFGTDDQVRVERQLISRTREDAGRKTTRWTFHFRIKVTNFGPREAVVQVADQLPISEVEKVTVKTLETTDPLPARPDDGPGILKWRLVVPPGRDQVVDIRFSVTAPDDAPSAVTNALAF